jgi:hypothetical protein
MDGMTPTTFDPQGTTTRAQLATVLYRMEGKPAVSDADRAACPFTDLKADWYRDAVVWAYKAGVVNGVSETVFDPDSPVTREQMVAMLWRWKDSPESSAALTFTDADSIAEVYEAIRLLAGVMDKTAEGEAIIADMQATFDDIAVKSEKTDKTIYFEVMPLEWGLWSAGTGTFMHELAELCGMQNAFADIEGWQSVSQEQVIERNPDYIVLVTGMGEAAPDEVKAREGWGSMDAIVNNAIYNADSYEMTRPAPRLKNAAINLYNFLNGIEAE